MHASAVFTLFFLFLSILFTPVNAADSVDYKIKGVNDDIEANINAYLSAIDAPQDKNFSYFESKLHQSVAQAVQVFGYYQPDIKINLTLDDNDLLVFIKINLGPQVMITKIDVQVLGDARQDLDYQQLLARVPFAVGQPLNDAKYDNFKQEINKLALANGYFDAQWQHSSVSVDVAKRSAEIKLVFDSKQRYVFGAIDVVTTTEAEALIYELASFSPGQPYQSELIAKYSLALFNSNYFQNASVVPSIGERKNGRVPVIINVVSRPSNTYEVGIGYLSDVGPRGKLGWTKPWVNDHGDSISAEIEYSQVQQIFTANYNIPIEDPITNVARIQIGYQAKDNEDTDNEVYSIQFQRQFELESKWLRTWFIKWEQEDFVQGSQIGNTTMILPGVSFARTQQKGGFDPYWGNQHLFSLEVASPVWGADTNLAKVQARAKYLRSVDRQHYFTTRFDLGAIMVDDILSVPASMRFFAGGSQTIRGYSYETVAPQDSNGEYIGGRYMAIASLEYGYQIAEKWRVSIFTDAGTSTNDFSEPVSVGIGTGLRWLTPIGPVKVDFAVPVDSISFSDVTFHLYIGPEL